MTPTLFAVRFRTLILFLASGRLAVILLFVIIGVLGIYLFVPQVGQGDPLLVESWIEGNGLLGRVSHLLWLTNIRNSWLFFHIPYGFLFVNLIFCMIKRFPVLIRMSRIPKRTPRMPTPALELECPGLDKKSLARLLGRKGYRTLISDAGVYGLRGRFSLVGSWIFHVSFLVLMVSGLFLMASPKAFRGKLAVGEGEFFDLHANPFLNAEAPPSQDLPPLQFELVNIEVVAEGSSLRHFESTLVTPEGASSIVGINRPYRLPPYQVMSEGFGYMPGWAIHDLRGRVINRGWVKLVPFPLEIEDSFSLGSEVGGMVYVTFYPDYEKDSEGVYSRSYEDHNPKFKTRIEIEGEPIFEGLLEPGQQVAIDERSSFFFLPEIRMYTILDVIQEENYSTVFFCFGGMIFGLVFRYARIRKEIWVQISEKSVQIAGRSEILEALFQEELEAFAGHVERLNPRLSDGKTTGR